MDYEVVHLERREYPSSDDTYDPSTEDLPDASGTLVKVNVLATNQGTSPHAGNAEVSLVTKDGKTYSPDEEVADVEDVSNAIDDELQPDTQEKGTFTFIVPLGEDAADARVIVTDSDSGDTGVFQLGSPQGV